MRKLLSLIFLLCACSIMLPAQSSKEAEPVWVKNPPKAGNSTYFFPTDAPRGEGSTKSAARNDAIVNYMIDLAHKQGAVVTGSELSTMVATQTDKSSSESSSYSNDFKISTPSFKVSFKVVSSYFVWENSQYTCYVLMEVANNPDNVVFDEVTVTNRYGSAGFVRSLIPGWGQMYKGSVTKGGIIIGAEVLGIGGIVASYSLKGSYEKLITEDPKHTDVYSAQADMWTNIGYGCIAFTAAVYVYNLIDAAVAPGASRVIVKPGRKGLSLYPTATPQGGMGLQLAYRF